MMKIPHTMIMNALRNYHLTNEPRFIFTSGAQDNMRYALEAAGVGDLIEALLLAECVYRKNCVAEGEPSSVLEAMQAALTKVGALP